MSHPALFLKAYLAELNERITKLEKLYDMVQTLNNQANKLNEKFDLNMQTVTEQMQMTGEAVQECREFVNLFNKTFDEINLNQQKPALERSTTELSECVEMISSSGAVEVTSPHIVVNLSELGEKDSMDEVIDKPTVLQDTAETDLDNIHDGTKRSIRDRIDELLSSFDY